MKSLSCQDLGAQGCSFRVEGETSEEVMQKMYEHAQESHRDVLEQMGDADRFEMKSKMEAILNAQE